MDTKPTDVAMSEIETTGRGNYVVADGDSIESIAFGSGFLPDTLWNLPENAKLRDARKDRNILLPEDRLTIPPKRMQWYPRATDARHTFRRKAVPSKFRLQVLDDGIPQANVPYELVIADERKTGRTDAAGRLEHWVPPDIAQARLRLLIDGEISVRSLHFGFLHPIESPRGIRQRLANLGYRPGWDGEEAALELERALREFQSDEGLPETGVVDEATRSRLARVHDQKT